MQLLTAHAAHIELNRSASNMLRNQKDQLNIANMCMRHIYIYIHSHCGENPLTILGVLQRTRSTQINKIRTEYSHHLPKNHV